MNLNLGIYGNLYMRLCRTYARYRLGDKPADSVMRFLNRVDFWRVHRYWPRFKNPRSFSEKVYSRLLFDRDPQWTLISDKLLVRDYVASKVGNQYLVPLLWKGDRPEDIPFDELPLKFVIKANHGCKYNIIVKDKTHLNKANAIIKLNKWLDENYCTDKFLGTGWAYKNIKPIIIVESFIENNGKVPEDYKFFCYSGQAEFIQVSFDRFGDATERILDRNFNPLDLYNGQKLYPGRVKRPDNYEDMLKLAESLALGFDFIRVDLYSVGGRLYFGELTCYPAGGRAIFIPRKYDFLFGEKWKIRSTH